MSFQETSELQVVGSGKPQSPTSSATRSASLDSLDSLSSEDEEDLNVQVYVYNSCSIVTTLLLHL